MATQLRVPTVTMVCAFESVTCSSSDIDALSQDDLFVFQGSHFGSNALNEVMNQFSSQYSHVAEVEEDASDYYPDGSKRTLTENQIAMFRHSEIQALLRERRQQRERESDDHGYDAYGGVGAPEYARAPEDYRTKNLVVKTDHSPHRQQSSSKKRKVGQETDNFANENWKHDCTAEEVNAGLLDHGEVVSDPTNDSLQRTHRDRATRRIVSYEDVDSELHTAELATTRPYKFVWPELGP